MYPPLSRSPPRCFVHSPATSSSSLLYILIPLPYHTSSHITLRSHSTRIPPHLPPHLTTPTAATNLKLVRQYGIHLSVPSSEDHSHCLDTNTYSTTWTHYYLGSLASTIGLRPNRSKTGQIHHGDDISRRNRKFRNFIGGLNCIKHSCPFCGGKSFFVLILNRRLMEISHLQVLLLQLNTFSVGHNTILLSIKPETIKTLMLIKQSHALLFKCDKI
jgi:hypothetical protein